MSLFSSPPNSSPISSPVPLCNHRKLIIRGQLVPSPITKGTAITSQFLTHTHTHGTRRTPHTHPHLSGLLFFIPPSSYFLTTHSNLNPRTRFGRTSGTPSPVLNCKISQTVDSRGCGIIVPSYREKDKRKKIRATIPRAAGKRHSLRRCGRCGSAAVRQCAGRQDGRTAVLRQYGGNTSGTAYQLLVPT